MSPFKSSSCKVWLRSCRLKKSVLDELIFNGSGFAHLACRSISTMESHECICQFVIIFSFDIFVIDILRNGVVDVKQCNCIIGDAKSDVLAECSVDINFAGYRDTSGSQDGCLHSKVQIRTVTGMPASICQQMQHIFLHLCELLPSQEE